MAASRSGIPGRLAGSRFRHRRTVSANSGARVVGRTTGWPGSVIPAGGVWVKASTMVIPRPQMSPAADNPTSCASGASYKEGVAMFAKESPARRTLSLASFSWSLMTRKFGGFSAPCTNCLLWRKASAPRPGRSKSRTSSGAEGAVRKNLSQGLISPLHHHEEKWVSPELATPRLEKTNQMGVGDSGKCSPARDLRVRKHRIRRDELDRGVRDVQRRVFGEEDDAVV